MIHKIKQGSIFSSLTAIFAIAFAVLIVNFSYVSPVLAGDNYSAATDTYQETRNPNRVDTTTKELAESNLSQPEEAKGESIYENLVKRVDQRRDEALGEDTATSK